MSHERPPAVLSPTETAEILRVHPVTIRRLIARGEIPVIRVGRTLRIPAKAIYRLLYGATGASPKSGRS